METLVLSQVLSEEQKVMMMLIDALRPLLYTGYAKWADQPPKVMKQSQR